MRRRLERVDTGMKENINSKDEAYSDDRNK